MSIFSRPRRRGFLAVLTLLGLLATALPAHAEPTSDGLRVPDRVAIKDRSLSEGVQTPPPALRPHGAKALPAPERGITIKVGERTPGVRMVEGAEQALDLTCTTYISKQTTANPAGPYTVRVDYLAELVCNFYLNAYGRPYLIERTAGFSGILHLANGFLFSNDYYGYMFGSVVIDGRTYEGARKVEVGFDVALRTIDGTLWGGCFQLPDGQRYLVPCDGLGTTTIYATIGSGIFDSGLPAYNPAAIIRDSAGISLLNYHIRELNGLPGDPASTARQNILDQANGLPAKTSTFSHVGATNVDLDPNMLKAMIYMNVWDGYTYRVTALAGSRHGSQNSAHYRGKALDVDQIFGVQVNAANPYWTALKNSCLLYGATVVLGPGDPDHDTHVHCQWP
jgi:hypothetical protein